MEGFGASVAVASRLAELIDHELLSSRICSSIATWFQREHWAYRQDNVERENVLNAAVQRL